MTSSIHPDAIIADSVQIGPYCVIEEGVEVKEGTRLASHVILHKGTVVGKNVQIDSFSVIGGDPQYRSFNPATLSGVIIGDNTTVRESVTINRGIPEGGITVIGSDCLLMACSHVAHDCVLGDHVTLTNAVLLGGHVTIGSYANLGGAACVHQRVRIGESAMIGGNAIITADVPPFVMVANRNETAGLNLLGLKRRGFDLRTVAALKRIYKDMYTHKGSWPKRAQLVLATLEAEELGQIPELRAFLEFFMDSTRGNFAQSGLSRRDLKNPQDAS